MAGTGGGVNRNGLTKQREFIRSCKAGGFVESGTMEWLKSVTGKVVSGLVALAVVAGGISWWSMTPGQREQVLESSGKILGWLGLVLAGARECVFMVGTLSG